MTDKIMADGRIKILQITGNTNLGGVASCLLNYMEHCDLSRYRFDFAAYSPSPFDDKVKATDAQSQIFYIPRLDKDPLKAAEELKKFCLEGGYAAVHSHMTILSAIALEPAAKCGVPVRICHAHSSFNKNSDRYLIKKFMRPFAGRYATHLAACSRSAAESVFKKQADKAFILPNAIDTARFSCSESEHAEAKKACSLTKTTALFTGRFAKQKNLGLLIRAFAEAKREDMQLVLLGDGPEKKNLEKLCGELNLQGKVIFAPPCKPDIWYKAADVFCLPSLYEGMSVSALEAQASGLKCLFSDAVARETDVTGGCEFLANDINAWSERLRGSFERDYFAKDKVISAGYDISREARRLTDYYDDIIGV
ncbi:MAG: glycosyltransferase [Clostridia bacterium]|nr:glycosyltransferase [Clostridia bacterium]